MVQRHGLVDARSAFTFPVTPSGEAGLMALATHASHRYAGDQLVVAFEADPGVLRRYVPEPLELDGSGLVYLWSAENYLYTSESQSSFVSLARSQFCESFFWIPCDLRGERYHYLLYSWVNRDWMAFQGRGSGVPHKVANVQMTRFHPADTVYNRPRPGVRVSVAVENVGLVLRASCRLERKIGREELPFRMTGDYCPRFVGRRHVYDSARKQVVIDDLCAHWGTELTLGEIWAGPAELNFHGAENEEVLPFQPLRVLGGYWFDLGWGHSEPPSVIHDYLERN